MSATLKFADILESAAAVETVYDFSGAKRPLEVLALWLTTCATCIRSIEIASTQKSMRPRLYMIGKLDDKLLGQLQHALSQARKSITIPRSKVFNSPFSIQEIEAGVWTGSHLAGEVRKDALINMWFQARCGVLPLHCHPGSARVVLVIEGRGTAYHSPQAVTLPVRRDVYRVPVKSGTVLCYFGDAVHSFSSGGSGLELLTYHSNYLAFENPEQMVVTSDPWTPAAARSARSPAKPPRERPMLHRRRRREEPS